MATTFGQESFLDLKFNNHWVSEYGLVVVSDGSRYSETLFPEFNHTTTTVPGKTGTTYWGTTITGRNITKELVTDGMTSRQYAAFKANFRPGTYAELRLAESAYKYTFAYVNYGASFNFVPFEGIIHVDGVNYTDTIYKGECSLTFFAPDPCYYSDYYLGASTVSPIFDYTREDWFIESGLPLNSWLALEGGNIQLALGNWYGTAPSSATTIKCYHAGNATARANLNFKKTYPSTFANDTAFLAALWPANDYIIDEIVITEPRLIKDIRYTYEAVIENTASWATTKVAVQIDLEENLDSSGAGVLRQIVNAAATVGDITLLKTRIRDVFITNRTYIFSINGIELQSRMQCSILLNNPLYANVQFAIDDNIGDSLNNKYITLPGSTGVDSDGALTYTTITSNNTLLEPEVYFRNTYE